jgi:ATP-dependent Clp protease ATP-binding subunit ClpB
MEDLKSFFKPEFLNRVDEIVIFHALNKELLMKIVDIQMNQMKQYLKDRHVEIALTDNAKAYLAEIGYDPLYGARPLKRAIQREILNPLATKFLDGTFRENDGIEVDIEGKRLTFRSRTEKKQKNKARLNV